MNIIDAINSGKPFQRRTMTGILSNPFPLLVSRTGKESSFNISDILANDWEVEEKRVTISLEDLRLAFSKAVQRGARRFGDDVTVDHVARELGLL